MQQALHFLEAVLPATGLRVVASKPPQWAKGLKHEFLATNEEVVRESFRLDKAGVTTYIALATYADPNAGRTADNTEFLQCLWVDVDYKHYASPQAAADDVQRLIPLIGAPTVRVQSGGGLHAYWSLREPLPTEEWKVLAEAFQATWASLGIKADPISADAARILRLPGTHNFKPEYGTPREVQLEVLEDLTYDAAALLAKLGGAKRAPVPRKPANVPAALAINDDLGAGFESRPTFIQPLAKKCRQVAWAFANQAVMNEPQWYATIQLVRHVEDGRKVAHIFSNKHPGYSKDETDAKLEQLEARGIGPTTCSRFKSVNPRGCQGCEFNITSPIVLGFKEAESTPPTVVRIERTISEDGAVVAKETRVGPPIKVPDGFDYQARRLIKKVIDPETKLPRDEEIFEGYLCPERLIVAPRQNNHTEIQMYVEQDVKGVNRFVIPGKALSDKRDLARELNAKGVFYMSKNAANILELVQRMVQQVQNTKKDTPIADQMGWQDDGEMFVVGATGYRSHGEAVYDLPVPASTKPVVGSYEPKGSMNLWRDTADVYNRPGGEAYQFALVYGAAGIFLPISRLSGAVLSLYSQNAGRGKTTAGYAALSWWGNPTELKSQSKDTNNALFHKASRHKNLPILMDEITSKTAYELEDLIYYMTQGREKESLTANREARPVLPGWALPAISTSNNSIRSKLQSVRGDAQGLFARIIEVQMDLPFADALPYADRMTLRHGFEENYGLAGPRLVQWAQDNRDTVSSLMDKYQVSLDRAVEGDSAYRFWVASCAAALTACAAAKLAGILHYDTERLSDWISDVLRAQRLDTVTSVATPEDVLGRFLEQNTNRILVAYQRTVGAGSTASAVWPEDGVHGNQLVGRAEVPERTLYLSMPAFGRFCHEHGFDLASFIRRANGERDSASGETLLRSTDPSQQNLGRGTKMVTGRVKALQFNLMHPALREFVAGVDQRVGEVTNIRAVK